MGITTPDTVDFEYDWLSAGDTPAVLADIPAMSGSFEETMPPNPIGVILPLAPGTERSGLFAMNYDVVNAISTNLRMLVMTNHGERPMMEEYGANLRPLCAEYSKIDDFDGAAMIKIQTAVRRYLPMIQLGEFNSVFIENNDPATLIVQMNIRYSIPSYNSMNNILKVSFNLM